MPSERPPAPVTPPFSRTIGLVALVALVCEVVLLPRLVGLDSAVWRAILQLRYAGMDRLVDQVVLWTTRGGFMLVAAATVLGMRGGGIRVVWPPLAVCLLGLQTSKLLKNVLLRERPSMLPGIIIGHSFPSGHVMNTTLAALAVVVLTISFRHRRRWWIAASAMVAVVFAGRLLLAHHWLCDAIGGLLAALAVYGLVLPVVRCRPLLAPAALSIALALTVTVFTHHRALAIRLPSPLSLPEPGGIEVMVADALGTPRLQGEWEPTPEHFRRGRALWMRGTGIVGLDVPTIDVVRKADDPQRVPAGWQASLAFAGIPDMRKRTDLSMTVTVNGQPIASFIPFYGWREYRVLVPPGTVRAGHNEVRLDLTDARGAPWRFALVYVRLDLD